MITLQSTKEEIEAYLGIDPTFFPLGEIPYDAYQKLLGEYKSMCRKFIPTNFQEDLKSGDANSIIYWYPVYLDYLYKEATENGGWKEWLSSFAPQNPHLFIQIFKSTAYKLDNIRRGELKYNRIGELTVKPKKTDKLV